MSVYGLPIRRGFWVAGHGHTGERNSAGQGDGCVGEGGHASEFVPPKPRSSVDEAGAEVGEEENAEEDFIEKMVRCVSMCVCLYLSLSVCMYVLDKCG